MGGSRCVASAASECSHASSYVSQVLTRTPFSTRFLAPRSDLGVLLLNASLTVRAHSANSHSTIGWEKFTDAIIDHINKNMSGVVFLLWGAFAGKKGGRIDKVGILTEAGLETGN